MGIDKVILPRPRVLYQPTYAPNQLTNAARGAVNTYLALEQNKRSEQNAKILQEQNQRQQERFQQEQQANARKMALQQMQADYYAWPAIAKDFSDPKFNPAEAPGYIKQVAQITGRDDKWTAQQIAQFVNEDGTVDPVRFDAYRQKTLGRINRYAPLLEKFFTEKISPTEQADIKLKTEKALTTKAKREHPEKFWKPEKLSMGEKWIAAKPGRTAEDWLRLQEKIKDEFKKPKDESWTPKERGRLKRDLYQIGARDLVLEGAELNSWVSQKYNEILENGQKKTSNIQDKFKEATPEDLARVPLEKNYTAEDVKEYYKYLKQLGYSKDFIDKVKSKVGTIVNKEAESELASIMKRRRNSRDVRAVNTLKRYEKTVNRLPRYAGNVPFGSVPRNITVPKKKKQKKKKRVNYIGVMGLKQPPKGR